MSTGPSISDRIVMITGGSGGICGAMSRSLIASGYKVAVLDIVEGDWIRQYGDVIQFIKCDVRNI